MTGSVERLARFADGATVATVWPGEGAAELMRADVRAALSAVLTWSSDWDSLRDDEEVLLAVRDLPTRRIARVMARLHRMVTKPPRGALADHRGGAWIVWQSTWGGEPLPDTFRPFAFARPIPPQPQEDA